MEWVMDSHGVKHPKDMNIGIIYTKNIAHAMKITKPLAQFLANEGALTKFVVNHINQNGKKHNFLIHNFRLGFMWYLTPEEYDYWEALSDKYEAYCFELSLNYNPEINEDN
jgi:hypothetical protein